MVFKEEISMKNRMVAPEGMKFVLTMYGFEDSRVRRAIAANNTTAPISWLERGLVALVKENK